jgi:hydrogenase-4 component B
MSGEQLVLFGAALAILSGVPGFQLSRFRPVGQWLASLLVLAGGGCGLAGIAEYLGAGKSQPVAFPSPIAGAEFTFALDAISVVFLLPIYLVSVLGAVYGLGYWKQADHPDNGRKLSLFFGALAGSMALLVVARDGVSFLFAWEGMALSAFFAVATDDTDDEVRAAGWLYLAASHFATLCLFGLFGLLALTTGTFAFAGFGSMTPGVATAAFLLALAGFGTKAGIMPLHIWLPSAHAMAPNHVSALMSGVVIKMGVYGIVRVAAQLPAPPVWWGELVLALGVVSGVLGVAFAIGQHDLKRLLAYHSIENIGIIVIGLGLALVGRSLHQPNWILLGLGGALLHVWNHALFKSLLFLSAGSVIHATGTREIDHLGGLSRTMPYTSAAFLIGAAAICGLPPLNGFVSELLIFLGLFRTLGFDEPSSWGAGAFAAPALAMIGTLAVACFVKVFGAVFLGNGRSHHVDHAHEACPLMLGPMAVLAGFCVFIGVSPVSVAPALERAVQAWGGPAEEEGAALGVLAPLDWVSGMAVVLLTLLAVGALALRARVKRSEVGYTGTWDCGYAAPTARMQYTSSSFAQMLVTMFAWALRPRVEAPRIRELFPKPTRFRSEVPDTVLDRGVFPAAGFLARVFGRARYLQQGWVEAYLLYILAILIVLLLWP